MRRAAVATESRVGERVRIGCAGWSIPKVQAAAFPSGGSHLQRYAARLDCVEINSSFYRSHQAKTYARWAHSVPAAFRFTVKMPRAITHEHRLEQVDDLLESFFSEVGALDEKLGCVLVQLPPSLRFDLKVAGNFLELLRRRHAGSIALEPRHATWFSVQAEALLTEFGIGRVGADPAVVPAASLPGGAPLVAYFRLHGSPKIYYSTYAEERLAMLAAQLRAAVESGTETWCIFDNTALGAATSNALQTMHLLEADAQ